MKKAPAGSGTVATDEVLDDPWLVDALAGALAEPPSDVNVWMMVDVPPVVDADADAEEPKLPPCARNCARSDEGDYVGAME